MPLGRVLRESVPCVAALALTACGGRAALPNSLERDAATTFVDGADAMTTDGGTIQEELKDAGSCNPEASGGSPTTCPNGCCDKKGRCQPGTANDACGYGGHICMDCNGLPAPPPPLHAFTCGSGGGANQVCGSKCPPCSLGDAAAPVDGGSRSP